MSAHPAVAFVQQAWSQAEQAAEGYGSAAQIDFIMALGPDAMMRRIRAERQILDLHQRVACGEFSCDCRQCCAACRWTEHDEAGREPVWGDVTRHVYPCRTLLLLAQGWGWAAP